MASFKHDPKRRQARLFFRFRGRQHNRTVPVVDAREASRIVARIEDALRDVELGRLAFPGDADPVAFFLSGGKVAGPKGADRPEVSSVGGVLSAYQSQPPPHLEATTLRMQEIHARRILELVDPGTPLAAFDAQAYASTRLKATYRGRPIHRDTAAKELKTLRQAWAWVASRAKGTIPPTFALSDIKLPKAPAIQPFMTWSEVEVEIGRGAELELWDCLWLDMGQVRDLLEHTSRSARLPAARAMFAAAAYTGMRRSELCRSRLSDWRLEDGVVKVRQKKRDRDRESSTRELPIHADLSAAFRAWLEVHPGGASAFCLDDASPFTWDAATYHFIAALEKSKWSVVRGWHVLRHSFASNLAGSGVDQRIIDRWMGHSTSIRLRYQHLRPQDQRDAMNLL